MPIGDRPNQRQAAQRRNSLLRFYPPDDPKVVAAEQELHVEQLLTEARRAVAARPLTPEQVARVMTEILSPAATR